MYLFVVSFQTSLLDAIIPTPEMRYITKFKPISKDVNDVKLSDPIEDIRDDKYSRQFICNNASKLIVVKPKKILIYVNFIDIRKSYAIILHINY
jgi:hypothetical protein